MVTVAVAGGTGGFGKTIVQELVKQKRHKVIILSRKASPVKDLDVPVLAADYSNPASLRTLFTDEQVEIVISAIIMASEQSNQAQLNLIEAAAQTSSVERFMPSEFGVNYTPEMLSFHPAAAWWLSAVSALRASNMQFTRVMFGWLTDFLGTPHFPSNLSGFKYVLDFENRRAAIPGDGTDSITFLHSRDVGRYVAALVDEAEDGKEWPEISAFAGDRMTWGEAVKLAEEVTG
ncbi:unnamed protein product [Periconia digitata]|uniref:NmrA-like domain-containing protein n=1 Tax=Periconia digitata TaxID=1303443 RepID=A0A9W4XTT3_9PLEO|nr:unnamed protein product [Periconia digitata]